MFKVTVIVPVFNVAKYLEEAIHSALTQPEVGEVILVEDGSWDNSLELCQKLSLEYEKVRLLTHPQGKNMGVCQSRNMGIKNAEFDFIAFLDADDWYLPNRFAKEKELFKNPEIMAVYSLSAIQYPNGEEELFGCSFNLLEELQNMDLKKIYDYIMKNDIVLGHTNANTFRKVVFEKAGFFDNRLILHEDTELWNRISRKFIFFSGELEHPVLVARRHENNTISLRSMKSQLYYLWVRLDNIGLNNLYPSEKENFIYLYSRAISNSIRPHLLRKIVFHSTLQIFNLIKENFISHFYKSFKPND
ncbi:glycosyltransferase family 2 protein [Belliella pelovolcani]|uniref:glycosyltransferase family 2 protein n=1 Tax=Belliella pelovolcani TaxID=529505 RepID=UPI00391DF143